MRDEQSLAADYSEQPAKGGIQRTVAAKSVVASRPSDEETALLSDAPVFFDGLPGR